MDLSLKEIRQEIEKEKGTFEKMGILTIGVLRLYDIAPDSAAELARDVRNIKGLSNSEKEAYLNFYTAHGFRNTNLDSTFHYATLAKPDLPFEEDVNSYLLNAKLINRYNNRYELLIDAQEIYLELISFNQENPGKLDEMSVMSVYQDLANLYSRVAAFELALNIYNELLEMDLSTERECSIRLSVSNNYGRQEMYVEAQEQLLRCVDKDIPVNLRIPILSALGTNHRKLEEFDKAIGYFKETISLIDNETTGISMATFRRIFLGETYLEAGMIAQSDSIRSIVEFSEERLRPDQEIYKNIYFSRLELAKDNYQASVDYADRSIQLAEQFNMINNLQNIHVTKSEALEAMGEYDAALEVLRDYNAMNNLRERFNRDRELSAANVRYQLTIRENELTEASQTIDQLSNTNKLIIAMTILIVIGGIIYYYRNRIRYIMKEEQTRNKIARNLHDDLSGTLSSISFFSEAAMRTSAGTAEADSEQYLKMIDRSAYEAKEKINDIIWAIDPGNDDWESFLTKCKRFAADTLDSKDIRYEIDMSMGSERPSNLQIRQELWLAFKEMITNIARHSGADKVSLFMTSNKKNLQLEVTDNGKGIPDQKLGSGNGLRNIRNRISELNGEAVLKSSEKGTSWIITIPL